MNAENSRMTQHIVDTLDRVGLENANLELDHEESNLHHDSLFSNDFEESLSSK